MKAYYLKDDVVDTQVENAGDDPHYVSAEDLADLGVSCHHIDPDDHQALEKMKVEGGYNYSDTIHISPETMADYDKKVNMFFVEHLHADEEVRYFLSGGGYFDVRDRRDQWIRISAAPGDFLVLPAGIYHRFTLDKKNNCKVMRLFIGEPVWTPYNRPCDELAVRMQYVKSIG